MTRDHTRARIARGAASVLLTSAIVLSTTMAAADEAPPSKHRNEAMRISGIVLTSLGAATLVAGVGLTVAPGVGRCGELGCDSTWAGLLLLIPASTILAGVGIPLWVVGGQSPRRGAAAGMPPAAVPALSVGPRSASLRWTF
jgi:hypothetical protein